MEKKNVPATPIEDELLDLDLTEYAPIEIVGTVCGTGQLAAQRAGCEASFRRALRLGARGERAQAAALLGKALARWEEPDFGPTHVVAEQAQARLLGAPGGEASVPDFSAEKSDLDHLIAIARDPSTIARAEVQRADLAFVCGELDAAEALYRSAVTRLAAHWGDEHLEVENNRDALATLLLERGLIDEATALIERVQRRYAAGRYTYATEG